MSAGDLDALAAAAEAWATADPDPVDAADLRGLLDRARAGDDAAAAELADRLAGRLRFGTSGLRGAMAAGPNRMNTAMVRLATAGVAAYLRAHAPEAVARGVVVGHDARHRSGAFAADVATVLAAAGVPAIRLPGLVPTPVVAYSVRTLGAAAGIMVTASHNPPADNGYKLYWGDGAQIVPPVDRGVTEAIDAVADAAHVAMGPALAPVTDAPAGLLDGYHAHVARLLVSDARDVTVAYTAMHGVGAASVRTAYARAGFAPAVEVPSQCEPDPDFPTVRFPNPEEPGAMDLVVDAARRAGADVALANDPDADRLGVAIADPATPGGWRALRGDETGWLLADHLLTHTSGPDRLVATTVVSSGLLAAMADDHGVHFAETLTGFKWLARAGDARPGTRLVLGYEEALGYGFGGDVRDKDGVAAALVLAEVAALCRRDRTTLAARLDDIARRYGLHATAQLSLRIEGPGAQARQAAMMGRLREAPPVEVAGSPVAAARDLLAGDGGLPPSDVLVWRLADGGRVVIRPSGTEPKLKAYFEAVVAVGGADVAAARRHAAARLAGLEAAVRALLAGAG